MNGKDIKGAADILYKILNEGAYTHIALQKEPSKTVHLLVYGTMEKYFLLEYIVGQLCEKIKNNLKPMLLVSCYAVLFTDTPFPVVSDSVKEALSLAGKSAVNGFFAAVLARTDRTEYVLPAYGKKGYDEITYNMPSWLIGMYKKDFPDTYREIIAHSEGHFTHVCLGNAEEILAADSHAERTSTGFFVKNNATFGQLFREGKLTYMSYGSTLICEELGDVTGKKILDCCAAPGGKSVYLAKKGAVVTSCDIHKHRVLLIESYAKRMGVTLETSIQDATVFRKERENAFDMVLCDAPCSGFGVIDKKRDIIFNRKYEDILSLAALQKEILQNVSSYVKKGGYLLYSTCTVFRKENEEVVEDFLQKNPSFERVREQRYLPDGKGMEGFFVCLMKRN